MLLMIDNYDSFTYNLVQYFGELGVEVQVFRNDQVSITQMEKLNPDQIVISPGPCTPNEAGISVEAIKHFAGEKPILGVCLGHQSIGQAFGGKIVHAGAIMHGKTSMIRHKGIGVFRDITNPFEATRYHSLVIEQQSLPEPQIDGQGRTYSTGKRKDAVVRVWIKPGSGKITVNNRDVETYFARPALRMIINQPFDATGRRDQYDVQVLPLGVPGRVGIGAEVGARRHGRVEAARANRPLADRGDEDDRGGPDRGGLLDRGFAGRGGDPESGPVSDGYAPHFE